MQISQMILLFLIQLFMFHTSLAQRKFFDFNRVGIKEKNDSKIRGKKLKFSKS